MVQVYTPEELSKILKISVSEAVRAIEDGEVRGFRVAAQWRVTEDALAELTSGRGSARQGAHEGTRRPRERCPSPERSQRRNRNPEQVRKARQWVAEMLRKVAPDLSPQVPTKEFTANGKLGVLAIATTDTPAGTGTYFLGCPGHLLKTERETFLLPTIARANWSIPKTFVIPFEKVRSFADRWVVDNNGQKKFYVRERRGAYYLVGSGMDPLEVGEYSNAFHLFR